MHLTNSSILKKSILHVYSHYLFEVSTLSVS